MAETVLDSRAALEKQYGKVWDVQEFTEQFDVFSVMGPKLIVRRKSDGYSGTIEYQSSPRYYFNLAVGEMPTCE